MGETPRRIPAKIGVGPKVRRTAKVYFSSYRSENQSPRIQASKIAKRIFLNRHNAEMALQFNCELLPRLLVDLSYQSSDEDMDVDSINSADDILDATGEDDDIQVLACYRYNTEFLPQLAAGRAMTTELTECLNDLNLPISEPTESVSTFTEPSNSLIDWFVGNPPPTYYGQSASDHPIAQCSQFNPILESPLSPPLIDQRPAYDDARETHLPPQDDNWINNPHITGLAISISRTCGQPNDVYYTGCVVCGKDYAAIKEEITLGYLERTHVAGESYETRLAKRDAFEAGMKAGSFILIPRGVSEAAACDGLLYQITPEDDSNVPGPGVLPI